MYPEQKEKINLNLLSKLMVYKDRSGEVVFRVVRSFPDKEYVASGLHFKEGADYSGLILIEDMQGEIVEGFKYADGKFEGDVILKPGKNRVSDSGQICVTTEWYDCYYQTRVSAISNTSNCVFTGSFTTCYSIEVGGGSGGVGGGSGSNVGNPVTYTQSIRDNFTDPCLKEVLNRLLTNNFNGLISQILNNFNNNNYGSIEFVNELVSNDINYGGHAQLIDPANKKYKIRINEKAIANASQEFMAAVIIHEVLHAYLGSQIENLGGFTQHQLMDMYINDITVALNSVYGLGVHSATALAWVGLHENPVWTTLIPVATQNAYLDKIYYYRNDNGTRSNAPGTRCP